MFSAAVSNKKQNSLNRPVGQKHRETQELLSCNELRMQAAAGHQDAADRDAGGQILPRYVDVGSAHQII